MRVVGVLFSILPIPGAGQAYNGRLWRGLRWAIPAALALLVSIFVPYAMFVVMALWIGSAIDGIYLSVALPPGPRSWQSAFGFLGGYVALVITTRTLVWEQFKVSSSSMAPTITQHAHIVIEKLSYLVRAPAVGEVVVFDQPCSDTRQYIMRIAATGGQTVEVRCSVLYIDGVAQPQTDATSAVVHDEIDGHVEDRKVVVMQEHLGGTVHAIASDDAKGTERDFPDTRLPRCGLQPDDVIHPSVKIGTLSARKPGAGACDLQMSYTVPAAHVFVLGDHRDSANDSRVWGAIPVEAIRGKLAWQVHYPWE